MINVINAKTYCSEDISMIENYLEAVSDESQTWQCHHRRGITPEGKTLSADELDAMGLYKNRPASELIFLTVHDHMSLHNRGERHHMYGRTGKLAPRFGKKNTPEANEKNRQAHLGKHHTESAREKMSEAAKLRNQGRRWFNDGTRSVFSSSCPEGFHPGRILKRKSA